MTDLDLQRFQKLLQAKRISIMRDLGMLEERSMHVTAVESSSGPIYSDHMPELGTDAIEREKAFLFASRDGAYLSQLDEALQRIQDRTYGVCRVCGRDIPVERLEAVPTTSICVPCKEEEHRLKRKRA